VSVNLLHIEPNLDVCCITLFLQVRDAPVAAVSVKVIRNNVTATHFYLLRYYGVKKTALFHIISSCNCFCGVHPQREMNLPLCISVHLRWTHYTS
jgi:hypothetical protein